MVRVNITIVLYMIAGVKLSSKSSIKLQRAGAVKRKGAKSEICALRKESQR